MPSSDFPASVLQNGIKMANEPPKGIRANLLQSFMAFGATAGANDWVDDARRPEELKKLFYGLCFFHAIVQERRKFGPMGWNILYQFTEGDLAISKLQLKEFANMYDAPPYKALRYLIGQLNYGGRVTDDWDRRCLSVILEDHINEFVVSDEQYAFDNPSTSSSSATARSLLPSISNLASPAASAPGASSYTVPPAGADLRRIRQHVRGLPAEDTAEVFGLHENVNITVAISEAQTLFEWTLSVQQNAVSATSAKSSGSARGSASDAKEAAAADEERKGDNTKAAAAAVSDRDRTVASMASDMEGAIPSTFDLQLVAAKFPVSYDDSMNTVLVQELQRYNKLLSIVKSSLRDVQRALKGEIVMSSKLDQMATEMYDAKVPQLWQEFAYPSRKPLGPWISDLKRRIEMFATWVERGIAPSVFWFSGFFFTQSFLTGVLQNYARKYKIAIDAISFDFQVMPHISADHAVPPADGCYIHGLFLEGARWDSSQAAIAHAQSQAGSAQAAQHYAGGVLAEPNPRQLYSDMPVVWLQPRETRKINTNRLSYSCPVYKTSARHGVLTTLGQSSNYIIAATLPSVKDERHWVKRGVALLCQLDT